MSLSLYKNEVFVIRDSGKSVSVHYQYRLYGKVISNRTVGFIFSWRRHVFLEAVKRLKVAGEVWDYDPAMRIKLLVMALPKTRDVSEAYRLAYMVLELPFEDLVFWNYKFTRKNRDRAYRAFKSLYLE